MANLTLKITKKFEKAVKEVQILSELRLFFGVVDTEKKLDGMLVIDYMNINELGSKSKNIPARPFFKKVMFQQENRIKEIFSEQVILVTKGEKTALNAMKTVGNYLKKAVEGSIENGSYTPNAPSTILAKGGASKPLIDTRHGINAVGFKIYKGKTVIYKDIGGNL